jgi:sulfate transport system permease protein
MSGADASSGADLGLSGAAARRSTVREDPAYVRVSLIAVAVGFLGVLLVLPLVTVFVSAFSEGARVFWEALAEPDARAAIGLTLLVAGIAVPLGAAFGVAAAWAIAKFEFRGKQALITLIDLPFAVSPVISGLIFVLLFGLQGWFGGWLREHDVKIIFAVPGIVLATLFITFP